MDMICKQFENRVWDYLEGRAEDFSTHLKECSRCRNTLEKAEKLLLLMKEGAAPVPCPDYFDSFWPRLKEKIAAPENRRRPFSILKLNPIYYGALTAAAAALILWVSFREPDPSIFAPASPDYIMAPAGHTRKDCFTSVDYITGPAMKSGADRNDKIDYILPGIKTDRSSSWAV